MARLLIVDQHVLVRRLLWQILTDAGHEVVGEAEDGFAVLSRLADLEPDLVLFGLAASRRRDLTALRRMLVSEPSLPVVICTGAADQALARDGVRLGARGFIVKPFSRDTVLSAVRHAPNPPVTVRHAAPDLRPQSR